MAPLRLHATLVVVRGAGLLLRGASGSGKSDCALELLRRGHRLVADDLVELHPEAGRPLGRAPERLEGLLEVREVGVIRVADHFGPGALAPSHPVDAVVELLPAAGPPPRPEGPPPTTELLGFLLPRLQLQSGCPCGLASRLEVAARTLEEGSRG